MRLARAFAAVMHVVTLRGVRIVANKYLRLIKDTGIFALGSLGSKLILFLMVPLYTNCMTTAEYGTADLVFTVAQLVMPFVSVVIFDGVIRFGLARDENPANVLRAGLAVCAVGGAVTLLAAPLIGLYDGVAGWEWYLSTYVVLTMCGSCLMNYLKAKDRNRLYALLSVTQTLVLALCNVGFLLYAGMGIRGYLMSTCIGALVPVVCPLLFGGAARDLARSRFDGHLLKRMLTYSAPLILNNVSYWVIQSFDKVMLGAMVGAAALGIYTVATKIPSLINVVTSIFSQAWGISSVREVEGSNSGRYYSNILKALYTFVFGAAVVIIALVRPFMAVYVGEGFGDSWRYVPLLLVAAAFGAVASYYGSLYGALLKSVNNMMTTLLAALVNAALNVLLIPVIGVWGAVLGTVVAYAAMMAARMADMARYLPIDIGMPRFAASTALMVGFAALVSVDMGTAPVCLAAVALFALINAKPLAGLVKRSR